MYTSVQEAKDEIRRRWNDSDLQRKVLRYVGELPENFGHEPLAVLARQVATPNFEFYAFNEVALKVGLLPLCFGFLGDKMCSKNPDKISLGKTTFYHGRGRNNGHKITSHNIISFHSEDGKPFHDARTIWGEGFVSIHHRMLSSELPDIKFTDNTSWLSKMGGKPELFYHRFLALFVCHGVLFENFHTEGREMAFNQKIIWPAVKKIKKEFGFKPLIVPIVSIEDERDPYWTWYPGHLEIEVTTLLDRAESKSLELIVNDSANGVAA